MATQEQIEGLLEAFKHAPPAQMLQNIDASAAGMRAILIYLAQKDQTVSAGMISDHMNVSTARVAVLLKKLESKGLIERERDPRDARRVMVKLSVEGKKHIDKVFECVQRNIAAMIDAIGMDRLLAFAEVANEIRSIIEHPSEMDI